MNQKYKIVFLGVTLHGFDVEQIKQDLQQLLELNDGQIDLVFSGQRITLREGLLLEEGRALEKALKSIGLFIYLEEDNAPPARKKTTLALYKKRLKRTYLPKRVDEGFSVLQARHRNNLEVEVEVPSSFKLSLQGRFGRLNYLNNLWCIYGIAILCGAGMILFDIVHSYLWVALITTVIASLLSIRAVILRLHDLNKNGWYALILLSSCVPYIGGIVYLGFTQSLMFSRGSIIDNDYGLPAKQGHIAGLILTCVTSLFLIVTLSMLGIPVYQDYVLKSYVVESIASMDELKTLVADYHATYNSWQPLIMMLV